AAVRAAANEVDRMTRASALVTIAPLPHQGSMRLRMRRRLRRLGFWLSVAVIVSPAILVFLWMLSLSLKNEIDNLAYPPVLPNPPTFDNFLQVFEQNSIGRYLLNSIVVSGGATLT